MTKSECIQIFNQMIRGAPVPFQTLISLVSDYLTEIKYEKSKEIINLLIQVPQLIQNTFPTIIDYFCRKYKIYSLIKTPDILNSNVKKTILYYE